jgi:hypothetical protein
MIMRDQVEDVFFEIRTRARDRLDLVLPDHFGERDSQLRRAHGTGDGHQHFAAVVEMRGIRRSRVYEGCRVEMTVMVA